MLIPKENPVYFKHPIVNERLFFAFWKTEQAFLERKVPCQYLICKVTEKEKSASILKQWENAKALHLSRREKTLVYREVKFLELPHSVRERIQTTLSTKYRQPQPFQHLFHGLALKEGKKKYRQLVLKHHPDLGGSSEHFIVIHKAYLNWLEKILAIV